MSDDIPVTGLGKLAFKDKLASGDLEDNCVSTDNMIGRSVTTQILADGAVDATKMNSGYKTILGNVSDPEGRTVEEIPLDYFKEVFSPYIMEVIEEKIELLASSRIKEIVDEEFKKNT